MAFSKNDLRKVLKTIQLLLKQVDSISPVNHMDIKRKAITSYAMEHVVRPCNSLLEEAILADKEKGLTLNDIGFEDSVHEIEVSIKDVKCKLSECEAETPQVFY